MYVNIWMDLLKRSPLDEIYHHPMMEGLTDFFRVSWGGGQEPYAWYEGRETIHMVSW